MWGKMREFNPQILKAFGLKAKSVKRAFGSHVCDTNRGLKLLKTINMPVERLLFIHSAKEHLYEKGFKNIDRYIMTDQKLPYYEYNRNIYVVKDWIEGEECDFSNIDSVKWATSNLANMHFLSKGMKPIEGSQIWSKLGVIPDSFEKHYKELTYMYKKVRKWSGWNDFDIMFIKNYNDYIEDAYEAKETIHKSNYNEIVEDVRAKSYFCHDKFTNHNLQIQDDQMMVINFDGCCFKLPLNDLVRFLEKVMRKCQWDVKKGFEILEVYDKEKVLSIEEMKILYSLLRFPDKYWRLSNQHYNKRRHWMPKIYDVKMNELIQQKENKRAFLETLKKEIF